MKMINAFILLLFSTNIFAEYPYDTLDDSYNRVGIKATKEVSNMSPTKSQDGVGLCYGFSATSLLENYRCKSLNLNCLDREQQLSSIDVSSYNLNNKSKSIKESGDTESLLKNFKASNKKLAKESCAKFANLVHKSSQFYVPDEGQGWKYLSEVWMQFKNQPKGKQIQLISCTANEVKKNLSGLETSNSQIREALLNATSLENFLFKAIMPFECLQENNLLSVPDFDVESYPKYNDVFSEKVMADKIESVLLNNIPLEMSICTTESEPKKCPDGYGHAITLFGIREACSPLEGQCKMMVRIKNSYGWKWQTENNDGWVDLNTLIKASHGVSEFKNIVWLKKPGTTLANLKLERSSSGEYKSNSENQRIQPPPANSEQSSNKKIPMPDKWKNYKGIWRCPGNSFLDHYESGCTPFAEFK